MSAKGIAKDPIRLAQRVSEDYWPANRYFPIDPVHIAKQLGVKVLRAQLERKVSGALVKKKGEPAYILLEESDSDELKRCTCAHELGHYYLQYEEETMDTSEFRKTFSHPLPDDPAEVYATRFAAELLMPEREFRKSMKMNKLELKEYFGVSGEAIKWRLNDLKIAHPDFMAE